MPLDPLRPAPLVEQAAARLRAHIADGEWAVGTKLPGETALAKALGVGRSTVREALRALAGAGLVRARQGAGVFVIATEPLEDWPTRLRRSAVADVYEVRMMIEVQAVRLAAARRTDADITAIQAALEARRAAGALDDDQFVRADIALHAAVVAAAHNTVLDDLFAEFVPVLHRGLVDLVTLLDLRAKEPDCGDRSHTALVTAVVAGDAEVAGRVLDEELRNTLALITAS
ncbi:FadR/GntR family transcriptional regulator [Saccharothrix syringae]|uniref:FadR family transcriptional regulator n=1 Tax=Saccharothrix syringae TaxID=103733 RepID=A0A5Q0H0D2_SACSY|nr:FCD domain-containing protein [Saccharothrix syringae]QFZ19658.1 FadR family transcriptional regulator [Saccharothrix syringae]